MVVVRSMGAEITGEIIHRLADGRWFVVHTALQILGEIGDRTISSDLMISSVYHDDIRVRKEAIQTLGKLRSRGAVRMLCDLLTDKDEEIRFLALRTLGDTGDKMAVPHILPFLQKKRKVKGQKSDILRQTAIEALGRIGDPEAIPILLDLLRSKAVSKKGGEVIRKRLVEALGAIRDPELEEVFQSVMEKETDVAVREAAHRAILNLEPPERKAAL
jgi:HEAT repeat protein